MALPTTWLTAADRDLIESDLWPDAAGILSDDTLDLYLNAAREACEAFAPTLAPGAPFPSSWTIAQVMQARNIRNAADASPAGGEFDGGGYGLTTHPLDWQVTQLLRPRQGVGAIA